MRGRTAWALAAGKVAVSAALLVYLARQIEGNVLQGIGSVLSGPVTIVVVGIFWGIFVLGAVRWQRLTMVSGTAWRFFDSLSLNFIGQFFNQLLPTSFGGDAVRAWYARSKDVGLVRAGALVLSDRIIGLSLMALLIALLLSSMDLLRGKEAARLQIWAIVAVCILGAVGFAAAVPLFARYSGLSLLAWSGRLLIDALRDPKAAAWIIVVTLFAHILNGVAGYLLIQTAWPDAPAASCVLLFLAAALVSAVPVSYAGWGVREASIVYFLGEVGVGADAAFGASVMYGVLLALASLPGALFWVARTRS